MKEQFLGQFLTQKFVKLADGEVPKIIYVNVKARVLRREEEISIDTSGIDGEMIRWGMGEAVAKDAGYI